METWYIVSKRFGTDTIKAKLFKSSTEKSLIDSCGIRRLKITNDSEAFQNKDEAVKCAQQVIASKIDSLRRSADMYKRRAEELESIRSIKIVSN